MRRAALLAPLAAALAIGGAWAQTQPAPSEPQAPPPAVTIDRDAGLPEWEKVHAVFSHPRCANCHTEDAFPRWSGPHYGKTRVHGFNVRRGTDESGFGNVGLRCATCHAETNAETLHGPPGAPHWHLAPAEMVWWEKSSAEICAQIKDPARNGDRTLDDVAEHIRKDALVLWGWDPGPGREPAPGSPEETYAAIKRWEAAGAPCPEG